MMIPCALSGAACATVATLVALQLLGCASTTEPETCDVQPVAGRRGGEPSDPGPGDVGVTAVVGCQKEPLGLGLVADPEAVAPQVVWTGYDFAVGWTSPEGYRIRVTDGHGISNTLDLPGMPETAPTQQPQLFWSSGRLELYYRLSDSIVVDVFDAALQSAETRTIGFGPFRAVQMGPDRIAVVSSRALYLDGAETALGNTGVVGVGWNGDNFLMASVLGHGEFNLNGLGADGSRPKPAIDLHWCGVCNTTGPGAGSAFASSAEAKRHALVIAADRKLTVAIEGQAPAERTLLGESSDAAMFWDGARYVVLLADATATGAASRDIALLAVSSAAPAIDALPLLPISQVAVDERHPVGAAAGRGDYGIAWVRGDELVVQRCALTDRPVKR